MGSACCAPPRPPPGARGQVQHLGKRPLTPGVHACSSRARSLAWRGGHHSGARRAAHKELRTAETRAGRRHRQTSGEPERGRRVSPVSPFLPEDRNLLPAAGETRKGTGKRRTGGVARQCPGDNGDPGDSRLGPSTLAPRLGSCDPLLSDSLRSRRERTSRAQVRAHRLRGAACSCRSASSLSVPHPRPGSEPRASRTPSGRLLSPRNVT